MNSSGVQKGGWTYTAKGDKKGGGVSVKSTDFCAPVVVRERFLCTENIINFKVSLSEATYIEYIICAQNQKEYFIYSPLPVSKNPKFIAILEAQ